MNPWSSDLSHRKPSALCKFKFLKPLSSEDKETVSNCVLLVCSFLSLSLRDQRERERESERERERESQGERQRERERERARESERERERKIAREREREKKKKGNASKRANYPTCLTHLRIDFDP